jgi:hypothetical protein
LPLLEALMLVLVEPGGSRFRVTGAVRAVLLWACSAPDAVRLEAMVRGRTDLSAHVIDACTGAGGDE